MSAPNPSDGEPVIRIRRGQKTPPASLPAGPLQPAGVPAVAPKPVGAPEIRSPLPPPLQLPVAKPPLAPVVYRQGQPPDAFLTFPLPETPAAVLVYCDDVRKR